MHPEPLRLLTAPDERGEWRAPNLRRHLRPTADKWLPPPSFLPVRPAPATSGWTPWASSQGTPFLPRHSGRDGPGPNAWSPQQVVEDWRATQDADSDRVYDSVAGLAAAWHAICGHGIYQVHDHIKI